MCVVSVVVWLLGLSRTPVSVAYPMLSLGYLLNAVAAWHLFGESLGTGVAVALAAERQVGRVILQAPFTSAADIGASAYPLLPVRLLMKDQFRSDERIGNVKEIGRAHV